METMVNTFHMNLHLRPADCARCPVLRISTGASTLAPVEV
jgi:hypothetical protein